jgi:hypothetical protein
MYERATKFHRPLVAPGPAFHPPAEQSGVPIDNPFQRLRRIGDSDEF